MEIYTPTPEQHKKGDSIVVESYNEDTDVIYVGTVRELGENTLETSIPQKAFDSDWDIVSNGGKQSNWQKRFEDSQYMLYMKAEVKNSGDISISGT